MPVIIQKFGGKLLETPELIHRAARYIVKTKKSGYDPVVVVSAPGSTTDTFLKLARQVTEKPDEREMDMMLSVGERMAMALLAMAINANGTYKAVSFTGSQVGIITDTKHTDARIIDVKCLRIRETLERGEIPIVAGFQGVSTEREITTLGRGGSDATAVALTAALGAERCELVKESGAVHSADPELVAETVPLSEINYDTLEAITSAGAKVVQPRAVSLAEQHGVNLTITGPDSRNGTLVTDRNLETAAVAAVVINPDLFLIERDEKELSEADSGYIEFAFSDKHSRYVILRYLTFIPSALVRVATVTVVGWSRSISGKMIGIFLSSLTEENIEPIAWLMTGGYLTFIFKNEVGKLALRAIHKSCLDEGYIMR